MMQRALELARLGQGRVEPNPCVGAVIVDSHLNLLGEGFHEHFGGPHAEINALRNAGSAARGGALFVTLAPCHHHGKTPPCTQAVIAAGIQRVVIAVPDPAQHGPENGIDALMAAGIQIETGLCAEEATDLLAPFTTFMMQRRPHVHAKWAMTLDGKLASRTGHSQWISNLRSREIGHALRGRMDAILTGIGTVLADDPLLTARPPGPRTATRIVLDSRGRLPVNSQLVRTVNQAPVLLVTTSGADPAQLKILEQAGVEIWCDAFVSGQTECDLSTLLQELHSRQWTNILLEGGSQVLGAFHDQRLIDEVHCFIAPKLVGGADAPAAMAGRGMDRIPECSTLLHPRFEQLGDNMYVHGRTCWETSSTTSHADNQAMLPD